MIKLSVVIPVYNVEKYLRECLDSVVNQTLKDIEIIVVDNGASIAEKDIIKEFESKCNKDIDTSKVVFRVITFSENQGYGKALNSAFEIANGEYIGIVESDDFVNPEMFESLYNVAIKNDVDIVKSGYNSLRYGLSVKKMCNLDIPAEKPFTLSAHHELLTMHPSIWSCIYKKSFILENNIKFIEMKGSEWVDNDFLVETLYAANKISFLPEAYYNYREKREGSSSIINIDILKPYRTVLRVNELVEKLNIVDENILYSLSIHGLHYAKTMVEGFEYNDLKKVEEAVTEIIDIIDKNLKSDKKYKKFRKKFYKKSLKLRFVLNKIKKFRKKIISIRFSKTSKQITIFNKQINFK